MGETYLALLSVPVIHRRVHTEVGTCAQREECSNRVIHCPTVLGSHRSSDEGYVPSEAELIEPQVGRSRSQLVIVSFKCFNFLSASASRRSAWCSSSCKRWISDAPPPVSIGGTTEVESLPDILCTSRTWEWGEWCVWVGGGRGGGGGNAAN